MLRSVQNNCLAARRASDAKRERERDRERERERHSERVRKTSIHMYSIKEKAGR